MKRFISYGSIETFENKILNIQLNEQYEGKDENNNPIYNKNKNLSTIKCIASEKIHGTNASVAYSNKDGFWVQSRTRILTPEEDNFGTAKIAMKNKDAWMSIINRLAREYNIDLNKNIIVVYFEWAGQGIQKKSATDGLDKRAIIFQHFKVAQMEPTLDKNKEEVGNYWLETSEVINSSNPFFTTWVDDEKNNIFNIMNFKQWEFEVNLNTPSKSFENIMKIVLEEIEPNSPLGLAMGRENNIGEGVVLTFIHNENIHRMKVKGEKHSKSKVKVQRILTPEETEKMKKIQDFVIERACTEGRLEQGYSEVMHVEGQELKGDIKKTGNFMKWLNKDIEKEESRYLEEAGLTMKDINKTVSSISKDWLFKRIKTELDR